MYLFCFIFSPSNEAEFYNTLWLSFKRERHSETVRLRVQDLDFGNETLLMHSGKGDKDRATVLPAKLADGLKDHLGKVRALHDEDSAKGFGAVWRPGVLTRKYPNAPKEWKWQYVFPSGNLSVGPES